MKEIILGLRNEYQKNRKLLDELKLYCEYDDKKIKDFYFYIQGMKSNHELYCEIVKRRNLMQELGIKIKDLVIGEDLNHDAILTKDNNNSYYFVGLCDNYPICVDLSFMEKFSKAVDKVFESEFVRNININSGILFKDSGQSYSFNISYENISIYTMGLPKLYYNSRLDTIRAYSFNEKFLPSSIYDILNFEIPSEKLKPYHITTINNNSTLNEDITFESFQPCRNIEFSIEEQEKQIVLSKIR